jgi:hypothetical protein
MGRGEKVRDQAGLWRATVGPCIPSHPHTSQFPVPRDPNALRAFSPTPAPKVFMITWGPGRPSQLSSQLPPDLSASLPPSLPIA